uniref:TSC22 domain family protein 1 n=1 Tax=Denticeps clupeoides TaxID=299321 RepID=A0AAY4E1E1_9TELE
MHHPDAAGEAPGAREPAHPAIVPRRGGGASPGRPADDYQSLMQPHPPAPSSAPACQQPPHTLNIQPLPSAGAQMKKKSGFQITSVTAAQVSVGTTYSITEDAESCDDLDESHTEDLSSSEILDASLSRATDMGGPERSSSEETLNNFHEAETPGVVSPNQPLVHAAMVNGSVHHQAHHHHHHHRQPPSSASPSGIVLASPVVAPGPGASPNVTQKMPSSAGALLENAGAAVAPVTSAGAFSAVSGAAVNHVKPAPINAGSTNKSSSAGGPGVGGTGAGSRVFSATGHAVNSVQQQSGTVNAGAAVPPASVGAPSLAGPGGTGAHAGGLPASQAPAPPPPAAASSRFRVVKLDSSSEPFKKGRWTCAEFYDKEPQPAATPENPGSRAVESVRQAAPDSVAAGSESASGGLVGALSHYAESAGSGETVQHQEAPAGLQSAAQANTQDVVHAHLKTGGASSAPVGKPQQVPSNVGSLQSPVGPAVAQKQQLPGYTQPAQSTPGQALPVAMQQLGYSAAAPVTPAHVTPFSQVAGLPPEYGQAQQALQGSAQPLPANGQMVVPSQQQPVALPTSLLQPAQPQTSSPQMAQTSPAGVTPQTASAPASQPAPADPPQQLPSAAASSAPTNPRGDARPGQLQNGTREAGSGALYAALPALTATQLQDAQRLLLQHQTLLSLPKLAAGDCAAPAGPSAPPEGSGGMSALTAPGGLLKTLPEDGEEDRSVAAPVTCPTRRPGSGLVGNTLAYEPEDPGSNPTYYHCVPEQDT